MYVDEVLIEKFLEDVLLRIIPLIGADTLFED